METGRVVVIGAGVGGLSAAIALAAEGQHVTVLERHHAAGGKMRLVRAGDALIDAGPTVFTLKPVFEALFARAGAHFEEHVPVERLDVLARHAWGAGGQLDLFADVERSAEAIAEFAGIDEAHRFRAFSAETGHIFRLLDASFMRAARPSAAGLSLNLLRSGDAKLADLFALRPFETLWRALARSFSDPRLRQLFARYATYVGSSPLAAPGTLMLIAHAEQRGVWAVKGGMHALAQGMQRLAEARGATFRFGAHVSRIVMGRSGVEGVELATGERIAASAIVFNGDAGALQAGALGDGARSAARVNGGPSLSAVVTCSHSDTAGFALTRHNVFFDEDYASEFDDIFGQHRLPRKPTVYICAQDRGDDARLPAQGPERLLTLVNAPALQPGERDNPEEIAACLARAESLLTRCGLNIQHRASVVTTPQGFADLFPATGGAIYGRACHGMMAPFRRPGAAARMAGLYLAGGSAHPGPGVPMATISGMLAADRLLADRISQPKFRKAAMVGGISTR
jgi:1-hydroxycarotenoid 3,4-desaturase